MQTPDTYAELATALSKEGMPARAALRAQMSIKARAFWVLVNGKWVPRAGVMRHAK